MKGYIEIKEITSIQNVNTVQFTIVTPAREYHLEAGSSSERDNWVSMLWLLMKHSRRDRAKSIVESPSARPKSKHLS